MLGERGGTEIAKLRGRDIQKIHDVRKERSGEGEARTAYAVEAEQNPKESREYESEGR